MKFFVIALIINLNLDSCLKLCAFNSIEIQKERNEIGKSELSIKRAWNSYLPTAQFKFSNSYDFVSTLNPDLSKNERNTKLQINSGIYSQLNLFNGLKDSKQVDYFKLQKQKNYNDLGAQNENVLVKCIKAFYQVLFDKGNHKLMSDQIEVTKRLLKQTKILVTEGVKDPSALYELEARLTDDQKKEVEALNNYVASKLNLKQLINANYEFVLFDSDTITDFLLTQDYVLKFKLMNDPQLKSYAIVEKMIFNQIEALKSSLYPKIDLHLQVTDRFEKLLNNNPYGDISHQLENNFTQYIGIQLSYNLFDQFSRANETKQKYLDLAMNKLDISKRERSVKQDVEYLIHSLQSEMKNYKANLNALNAYSKLYKHNRTKYQEGLINTFELNNSRERLKASRVQKLKSMYRYLTYFRIIKFYIKINEL